jgi:hypothetical protein
MHRLETGCSAWLAVSLISMDRYVQGLSTDSMEKAKWKKSKQCPKILQREAYLSTTGG